VYKRQLPNVREIVFDRDGDRTLYARNKGMQCFRYGVTGWQEVKPQDAEPPFRREYKRVDNPFWTWVQPPHGIYVQLHRTQPTDLNIGSACPGAHAPLMSRGRLTWDDLREVLVVENDLLFTTPAGVCCYDYDFDGQATKYRCLYGAATDTDGQTVAMTKVERLVREHGRTLLTWNESHVFRGQRSADGWQWEVDHRLTPVRMVSHKQFKGPEGTWTLQREDDGASLQVTFTKARGMAYSRVFRVGQKVPDVSRAVFSPSGIWCPTDRDVIWLDTSLFTTQSAFRRWVLPVGVGTALVLGACLLVARGGLSFLPRAHRKQRGSEK